MARLHKIRQFNEKMQEFIRSFKDEFPEMTNDIRTLENGLSALLAGNERAAYEKFKVDVKHRHGAKIHACDETFVEDARMDHSDNKMMPMIYKLWGQPGQKSKDPDILKAKFLTGLRELCDLCI